MKKIILLLAGVLFIGSLHAQVGINTINPLGWFHVDAVGNTGDGTTVANNVDDVVITDNGNVGIGIINPLNKLHIVSTTIGLNLNTGLRLTNGAGSGRVLTSDVNGDAIWQSSARQFQTIVHATGLGVDITGVPDGIGNSDQDALKLIFYRDVIVDGVNDEYGGNYGWSVADQQFLVPADGVYRLTCVTYLLTVQRAVNTRVYPYLNDRRFYEFGFMSANQQDGGQDQSILYSGLASLMRGDIIDFRTCVYHDQGIQVASGQVSTSANFGHLRFYAATGHCYFIIESL